MTIAPLEITFTFIAESVSEAQITARENFWDSPKTIQWFKDQGYTLYRRVIEGHVTTGAVPALPFEEFQEADYPYAYHDAEMTTSSTMPLGGKVAFAQDSQNRHVAIKIVPDDTDEYRILRFLKEQDMHVLKENCIMPVLEMLPIKGFWFAIMPRWGIAIHYPALGRAFEALDIMHSILKAVAFLHEHNICHGDIKPGNVAVNHFADSTSFIGNNVRPALRTKRLLSYAMFDFDCSTMLPPEMDRMTYRLPYQLSWGSFNLTMDTAQGEFDFNPFVLDVGTMGVGLCAKWQHLCGQFHFLAPLLDRMTTRNLKHRFTASEALQFFEEMYSQLTEAELHQAISVDPGYSGYYYEYDRWSLVPPDFAKKWATYREPPLPLATKVIRRLCQEAWVSHIVAYARWFSFKVHSLIHNVLLRTWLR